MKTTLCVFLLLILIGCNHQRPRDYVFCDETLISCLKTDGALESCYLGDLDKILVATFGEPDSVRILYGADSIKCFYYLNSYFLIPGRRTFKIEYVINDPIFTVIINSKIDVTVGDSPQKLIKYFPGSARKMNKDNPHDSLLVFFATIKNNEIVTDEPNITFEIFNNKISKIKFY
jgi:hypothetical protein